MKRQTWRVEEGPKNKNTKYWNLKSLKNVKNMKSPWNQHFVVFTTFEINTWTQHFEKTGTKILENVKNIKNLEKHENLKNLKHEKLETNILENAKNNIFMNKLLKPTFCEFYRVSQNKGYFPKHWVGICQGTICPMGLSFSELGSTHEYINLRKRTSSQDQWFLCNRYLIFWKSNLFFTHPV